MEKVFKGKRLLQVLIMLLLVPIGMQAQDVTVRSSNGNTVAAVKGDGADDNFFNLGGFALWKHNQLNLTMTTADSDGAAMSDIGQFENPANNIFKSTGEALILGRGNSLDCYVAFTLPKGYRFTGYTIVFRRNVNIASGGSGQASFGEADPDNGWGWKYASDGNTYKTGLSYSTSAANQTITRTDMSGKDMDNTLYFKLTNSDGRAFITLTSVTLKFTAEADYTPITPAGTFLNRTAVDVPFSTSCVDLGSIEMREYNGTTRMSYSYENVKDLMANLTLYQENGGTEAGTHYDGTQGQVVKYADGGTISSNGNYFQLGSAGSTDEQIYYIETPTYVELNNYDKTKNPIGYRIVASEINYTYGQARPAHTETLTEQVIVGSKTYPTFYISAVGETYSRSLSWGGYTYTSNGQQTYYLSSSAEMVNNQAQRAAWFIDDDGYIRLASDASKYLKNQSVSGTNNRLALVGSENSPAKFAINSSGQLSLQSNTNMFICLAVSYYRNTDYVQSINYFQLINNGTYKAVSTLTGNTKTINIYETQTKTLNYPAFTPSEYTLNVYDKTGTTVEKSIRVTSSTPDGSLKIDNMNNDAVKIGIVGVGLIQGTLTMQALDPYIDQMSVVCQDKQKPQIRMTQDFTASDFSVSGGEFYFYLPSECAEDGDEVQISFEDLYSHYADESYTEDKDGFDGTAGHYSRYNFVKSAHYNAFGTTTNNIYTNKDEAGDPQLERLKVTTVGSEAFMFNNAAEVGGGGGTLIEYPFTLESYGGTFDDLIFTVTDEDQVDTKYVFTTDETAYNIAPTTAIQHRSYAFYTMIVHVQSATYDPEVEFKPIYAQTLYGTGQTDAFYGAVITAVDGSGNPGFSSTNEIFALIAKAIEDGEDSKGNKYTDLKSPKQLLYLDFSQLAGVYQTTSEENPDMSSFSATNAKNCMIFVPKGSAAKVDNVASKTDAEGYFDAARDIVLTDKEPFYTPYNISVDAAQKITYKRAITKDKYGKVQNASLILPFIVAVDENGKHTNPDGTSFTLHTMKSSEALRLDGESTFAYFPSLSNVTVTTANTPYMVKLEENSSEDGISFVVEQTGSTIFASTSMASDYTFTGAASTGVAVDASEAQPAATYTFTPTGTYAGQKVPKTNNIFYFASNQFVSSADLITSGNVNIAPFRAYYATSTSGNVRLSNLGVIFEDGEGDTDAIRTLRQNDLGMSIQAGRGQLTISAAEDSDVRIAAVNGISRGNFSVKAGETRTVSVPAGIYVVNGVKIVVK